MNKFQLVLGREGDKIMLDRAASVAKLAEMAQINLVNQLEKKKIELDMKKSELLDMSPDNRYSLKPGLEFKADAWVTEYQSVCLSLINLEIEIKVAQETSKELFTEEKAK